jgi:ribosome biogenesis protein Nip4
MTKCLRVLNLIIVSNLIAVQSILLDIVDEECVEGPVPYHFGNALTKGTKRVEKANQYQSTMTFQLNAVKKKVVTKVKKSMKFVFGYVNVTLWTHHLLRKKKKMKI